MNESLEAWISSHSLPTARPQQPPEQNRRYQGANGQVHSTADNLIHDFGSYSGGYTEERPEAGQETEQIGAPIGAACVDISVVSDSPLLRKGLIGSLLAHLDLRLLRSYSGAPVGIAIPYAGIFGDQLIGKSEQLNPLNPLWHVALLDGSLSQQMLEAWIRHWRNPVPLAHVLVFDLANDLDSILSCIEAGATGCLVKGTPISELVIAIRQAQQGETVCSSELLTSLFAYLSDRKSDHVGATHSVDKDTTTERDGKQPAGEQVTETEPDATALTFPPSPRLAAVGVGRASLTMHEYPEAPPDIPLVTSITARELQVLSCIAKDCSNPAIAKILVIELGTVKKHVHSILEKLNLQSRHQAARYALEQGWLQDGLSPSVSQDGGLGIGTKAP
jgi:DNA-binding NarL/FixJ family response regulator